METMVLDTDRLMSMSPAELDALFRRSPAGTIPAGRGRGAALVFPGTGLCAPIAALTRRLSWQGKIFDPGQGMLRNLITPFGIQAIAARVYTGPSILDGQECVVLDYSQTSLAARWVRDEIREVVPGLYLGIAFLWGAKVIYFCLEFEAGA